MTYTAIQVYDDGVNGCHLVWRRKKIRSAFHGDTRIAEKLIGALEPRQKATIMIVLITV